MSVEDMLGRGELERVASDPDGADAAIDEARLHTESARDIRSKDRNGAYHLAYDAARKAVMAHMRRAGVRVRRGEGGHVITAQYAALVVDAQLGDRLGQMRRRRNRSEYGTAYIRAEDVDEAIAVAEALIDSGRD
jgi:hypothetical protein